MGYLIQFSDFTVDNITIAGPGNTKTGNINIAKTNYLPWGLLRVSISNASSGGTNASGCCVFEQYFDSTNKLANISVSNRYDTQAKVKVVIRVLYGSINIK
jgi:hypothetical protein